MIEASGARAAKVELDERDLAIVMHSRLCRGGPNCGWSYERYGDEYHVWTGTAHTNWLHRARNVLQTIGTSVSIEDTIKVLTAL